MRVAKKIEGRKCPICGRIEMQVSIGKNRSGTQRYRCNACRKTYTHEPKSRAYSEETRNAAIKVYYSGVSANQVGKIFYMNKANVLNWLKKNDEVRISPKTEKEMS